MSGAPLVASMKGVLLALLAEMSKTNSNPCAVARSATMRLMSLRILTRESGESFPT